MTTAPANLNARALGGTHHGSFAALVETTKPGITRLVTVTSMVGFAMAALGRPWAWSDLYVHALLCLIGTALAASGANAINQWMERGRDALMERTKRRPLPSGRVTPAAVLAAGLAFSAVGVGVLCLIGPGPALVGLACILSYVAVYTPLKPHTTLATFVGAIPGGLPPLIGWSAGSAAAGLDALVEPMGLALVALMLVWQIPHFLAIAWMYREDYAKGGYRVLAVIDPSGRWTAASMTFWALALIPATLAPAVAAPGRLGAVFMTVAAVTGLAYVFACVRFYRRRDRAAARTVFFASIMHLPVLLLTMVGEATVRALV